jgi:hypothetical protein
MNAGHNDVAQRRLEAGPRHAQAVGDGEVFCVAQISGGGLYGVVIWRACVILWGGGRNRGCC